MKLIKIIVVLGSIVIINPAHSELFEEIGKIINSAGGKMLGRETPPDEVDDEERVPNRPINPPEDGEKPSPKPDDGKVPNE